jgi:hypothetical protein
VEFCTSEGTGTSWPQAVGRAALKVFLTPMLFAFKGKFYKNEILTFLNSQLCMSGCSNKAWLKNGGMLRKLAHEKRIIIKGLLNQSKILNKDFDNL